MFPAHQGQPVVKEEVAQRYDVLGVPVSATSPSGAVATILRWAGDGVGRFVCVRDVHGVMCARTDAQLRTAHAKAAMVVPDGMPLVIIGRLRGLPVERTTGPDLMNALIDQGRPAGLRHYLYGGEPQVADRLKAAFEQRHPGVRIVGTECPPFRAPTAEEEAATAARIRASGVDVVWVGLSTPKQEHWMLRNVDRLPATLIGVGAAFDFHSGRVKRAPQWMQLSGLEWLHRLLSEPRRLWRRYLVLAPQFVFLVLFSRGGKK
jgi:N-acetylglucosaminyldiphosphoundecaprenol N-acetyl-beta-D-mannosaminyltransferase